MRARESANVPARRGAGERWEEGICVHVCSLFVSPSVSQRIGLAVAPSVSLFLHPVFVWVKVSVSL